MSSGKQGGQGRQDDPSQAGKPARLVPVGGEPKARELPDRRERGFREAQVRLERCG